jgi:hypothetical protein
MSQIDFNAVGSVANLKPPAARMRFTRLKKQIESSSLAGTQGATEAPTTAKKAKKAKSAKAGKKATRKDLKKESDTKEDMLKQEPAMEPSDLDEIPEVEELDFPINMELDKDDMLGDSYGLARLYGDGPGAEENDEDIPLAKKRKMASALLGMGGPPAKPTVKLEETQGVVPPYAAPGREVIGYPPGWDSGLTSWGPVGPAGLGKEGGRPATYDANKLAPTVGISSRGLGPFPSTMPDNPPALSDPTTKNRRLCNPDIPAIKITDIDADKPTKDCSKQPETTLGTVEERINNDLFGPENAHLWLPKKKDPVVTLPPGRTRIDIPVIALIEEHERRFGSGKK